MARCARSDCRRWRPDLVIRHAHQGLPFEGVWYCSSECLAAVATQRLCDVPRVPAGPRAVPRLRLGAILVHQGAITAAELRTALDSQLRSGLPLGAELVRLGLASTAVVLRGLAAQAGIGFLASVDPASVRQGPGNLSRDTVRALGVVPFEADPVGERLNVACTAPVPRMAIVALRELIGWTVEPFLVSDDTWAHLALAYGAGRDDTASRVHATALRSVQHAAARVAHVAARQHVIRMRHVRCDPYVWVHLEGETHAEDLRLQVYESQEGQACQAAPTSR